jgi:hypothetical protein
VGLSDDAIALAFRTGLPFVGLRDHEHDAELDNVVPPDAARLARVIPLTAADDHVRLAVADPEPDLVALTPYLEGRRVELAIAPREELEEILGPPPPVPPPDLEPAPFELPADVEPEAEAAAPAEPEAAAPEAEAVDIEAAEPEAAAPAEPEAAPPEPEPEAAAPADAAVPGEAPSWLAPPRKRRWLRAIGVFLLYAFVLAAVCGAVAAYLLTR